MPVGSPAVPPVGTRSPVRPDEVHSQINGSLSGPAIAGRPHSEPFRNCRDSWTNGQSSRRKSHSGLRATAVERAREERHHRRRAAVDAACRTRPDHRGAGHADHCRSARPCRISAVDRHRLFADRHRDGAALRKDFRYLRAPADHLRGDPDLPGGLAGKRDGAQHAGAGDRPGHPGSWRRRPVHDDADRHRRPRAAIRAGALCRLDLGHLGGGQHCRAAARRHLCRASALVADLLDQHPARPGRDGDHQQSAEEAARGRPQPSRRRLGRAAAGGGDLAAVARAELGRQRNTPGHRPRFSGCSPLPPCSGRRSRCV